MIRAVALDVGNVLIGLEFERVFRAASRLTGLPEEEMRRRLRDPGLARDYETGRMSSLEFSERFRHLLGLTISFDELGALWSDMFADEPLVDESLLVAVKRRCPLLAASNTNEMHFNHLLSKYPLFRLFDELVLSYQVGAMKPDAAFFEALLERSGRRPEEIFFTDDVEANVEGARLLGIDAEVFVGEESLRRSLRERGIEV
jgi:putative hydrolase of the HAD superfamily